MTGLALAAVLVLSGCGGADPAEVSAAASPYTASDGPLGVPLETEQAECRVRVLLESDLSDEAKADVERGLPPAPHTDRDVEVLREVADEIARECV
ncbi:hypothetical protein GCM10009788_13920 [Nocardioides humi]|uniref:DUF732 domain-containing protein n=1 Tax=Nocardioides humi TaxID=449461 RepID=A0ABN2A484_9ACTN